MPARAWRSPAAARSPKSLAARGGLVRTFGGLATFLVLTFLCAGIYLLEDAVMTEPAHPHWSGAALINTRGALVGVGRR